jgi:hypothetical protein
VQDHQAVIPGPPVIMSGLFEMLEKTEDAIKGQHIEGDLREPTARVGGDEGEKEPQGIAMGLDGGWAEALLERELIGEEGVEHGPN